MLATALAVSLYLAAIAALMRLSHLRARFAGIAACNLVVLFGLLVTATTLKAGGVAFVLYVLMVIGHYTTLRLCARAEGTRSLAAFLSPVLMLLLLNHLGWIWDPLWLRTSVSRSTSLSAVFLGLSYMAFRLSHAALEVRGGKVEVPALERYLAFAFFVPTLAAGLISPYSMFEGSVVAPDRRATPLARSLTRIVIGATKLVVLGSICNKLAYQELMLDGHTHEPIDLFVAAVAYYGYLYCNFAGFSDMAIGAGGLVGIRVHENFDRPFLARNIKDFWNRWHITLGVYMRDMVFAPMSRSLARRLGPTRIHLAVACSVMVVFILVGLWHGSTAPYLIFGVLHGAAAIVNHYYDLWLKRRLGVDGYRRYQRSPLLRVLAVALTFAFVTATLMLIAVDLAGISLIMSRIGC